MSNLFKISEAASIAFHSVAFLASHENRLVSAREIASRLEVSEHHLSKVLQRLVHAGLVKSIRGPRGGFQLARKDSEISLLEVYETIEGPISSMSCLLGSPVCRGKCILGSLLEDFSYKTRNYLKHKKLSQLGDLFDVSKIKVVKAQGKASGKSRGNG